MATQVLLTLVVSQVLLTLVGGGPVAVRARGVDRDAEPVRHWHQGRCATSVRPED